MDSTLGGFLALVESLPESLRQLWDGCGDRCFNVGIQAGTSPNSVAFSIASGTLRTIANVHARVEPTVYGVVEASENA